MPSKGIEYVKTIDHLEILPNSQPSGNPRFKIYFTDGTTAITQSDASVNYGLGNTENMGVPVLVKATPAGRVTHVTPVITEPQVVRVELRRHAEVKVAFTEGSPTDMHNDAYRGLLKIQGMSPDWAMRYEGWDIVSVLDDGTEESTARKK